MKNSKNQFFIDNAATALSTEDVLIEINANPLNPRSRIQIKITTKGDVFNDRNIFNLSHVNAYALGMKLIACTKNVNKRVSVNNPNWLEALIRS